MYVSCEQILTNCMISFLQLLGIIEETGPNFYLDEIELPHGKTIRNAFYCYELMSGTDLPGSLYLFEDDQPPGHRTIAPYGNNLEVTLTYSDGNYFAVHEDLRHKWKLHCFLMIASAEPKPLRDGTNAQKNTWCIASILFR